MSDRPPEFNAPYLEWALWYAAKGIPVFPLSPKRKTPRIPTSRGGHGVGDATTDPEQIMAWWKKWPGANIGGACGFQFDVLDIDAGGAETFRTYDDPKNIIAATKTVKGGWHIYYDPSLVPLDNAAGRLPGLDVRTKGGYVVLPPSFVCLEKDGKVYEGHYEWLEGKMLNGQALPPFPGWAAKAFRKDAGIERARVDLKSIWDGDLEDGKKHNQIRDAIFKMAKQGFDIDAAKIIVQTCIEKVDESRFNEPRDRVLKKYIREVDKCFSKHRGNGSEALTTRGKSELPTGYVPGTRKLVSAASITPGEVPWLFKGRVPLEMITLVAGDVGKGKSVLCRSLVAMVTTGRGNQFWDLQLESAATCIWLTKEESVRYALIPNLHTAGADVSRVLILGENAETEEEQSLLFNAIGLADIEAWITEHNAKLIVIDPLISFLEAKQDPNAPLDVRITLQKLIKICERTGCALLGICHLNKASGMTPMQRVAGSGQWTALARSVLFVGSDPNDDDVRAVEEIKHSLYRATPPIGYQIDDEGRITYAVTDLTAQRMCELPGKGETRTKQRECREWLESWLAYGPSAKQTIYERGKEQGYCARTIDYAANALGVSRGAVPTSGRGRGPAWWARPGYNFAHHQWLDESAQAEDPFE